MVPVHLTVSHPSRGISALTVRRVPRHGTARCGEAGGPTGRIRALGGSAGTFDSFPGGPARAFMSLINRGYAAGRNPAAAAGQSTAARRFLRRCPTGCPRWGRLSPPWAWPIPSRANKDADFPPASAALVSPLCLFRPCRALSVAHRGTAEADTRLQYKSAFKKKQPTPKKRQFKCSRTQRSVPPARPPRGHPGGACREVWGHPAETRTPHPSPPVLQEKPKNH